MPGHYLDIEFHSERAQAELDLARRASSAAAAKAHLDLSRLHAERLQSFGQTTPALQDA
jgi:hypothetical protein